jgi:hypothetical protein
LDLRVDKKCAASDTSIFLTVSEQLFPQTELLALNLVGNSETLAKKEGRTLTAPLLLERVAKPRRAGYCREKGVVGGDEGVGDRGNRRV